MANVLLLNMSIIPGDLKENYYLSIDGKKLFCGISSLEPGTKQFFYTLLSRGEVIDKIIIMASKETCENKIDYLNNQTVCKFYEDRILNFLNEEETFMTYITENTDFALTEQQKTNIRNFVLEYLNNDNEKKQRCLAVKEHLSDTDATISNKGQTLIQILNEFHKTIYDAYIKENDIVYNELINLLTNVQEGTFLEDFPETSFPNIRKSLEKTLNNYSKFSRSISQKLSSFSSIDNYEKKLNGQHFFLFPKRLRHIFENYNDIVKKHNTIFHTYQHILKISNKLLSLNSKLYDAAVELYCLNDTYENEKEKLKTTFQQKTEYQQANLQDLKELIRESRKNSKENELFSDYIRFQIIMNLFTEKERSPFSDIPVQNQDILKKQQKKAKNPNFFQEIPNGKYADDSRTNWDLYSSNTILNHVFQRLNQIASSENDKQINLYINTQGGNRNLQQILNSAVEMLQLQENIHIKQSIGTDFNRNNILHQIQDVSETNRMFEMVSGMYEFINYGKAQLLSDYYLKNNNHNSPEYPVAHAMENFSNVLALCSVDSFQKSLENLQNAITNYKRHAATENNADPLFMHFINYIENEYHELLLAVRQQDWNQLIIKEIRWCLNKKMYMQALTLTEAKIPDFFVNKKIFYYAKSRKETNNVQTQVREQARIHTNYTNANFNHDFIKYYLIHDRDPCLESTDWDSTCQSQNILAQNNKWYFISRIITDENGANNQQNGLALMLYSDYQNNTRNLSNNNHTSHENIERNGLLNIIYNEYLLLSRMRNHLNHANNQNEPGTISNYLNRFLDDINLLLERK